MRRGLVAGIAAAAALALPAAASAHAVLLRTVPQASVVLSNAPGELQMTFSEPVEPRFAIVSVTDASAHQQTAGPPSRSPSNPDTLIVPLKHVAEGWYLVYWRAISVDGHPVRGAFTFAVGPNAGPAPQFVIPSISETAATPRLLIARWIVFLSVMAAIGLAALRLAIARPVVRRVSGTRLRAVSRAFAAAAVVGLVAIPIYLLLATADFALRSFWSWGALIPLVRASAFGRGYFHLWIAFALFVAAASAAILVDRPERPRRSTAELLAGTGATAAAAATLLIPSLAGHASQTSPRGLALPFDWLHLAAGSVWIGGLAGLLVLWRSLPAAARVAGLLVAVPRFSNTAAASLAVLVASGTGAAVLHLPTVASLWQTSYGQAILWKIGLLSGAMLLAAVNLLRIKPRLAHVEVGASAARLLRATVGGETILVAAAIFAAAVLSSLAPPSKALASVGGASAHVGPGPVTRTVEKNGYTFRFRVTPNRAAVPNEFSVQIAKGGKPVTGADVVQTLEMLDMDMQNQEYRLTETSPGTYTMSRPALVMVGHWGLSFDVTPPGGQTFTVLLVDRANG
ncbi:MAG TPA: copper resistance protein CopC [Gaiellaceae bacterium]|nr:copper resistance protein CopC [Gaiellaceae bacterium]